MKILYSESGIGIGFTDEQMTKEEYIETISDEIVNMGLTRHQAIIKLEKLSADDHKTIREYVEYLNKQGMNAHYEETEILDGFLMADCLVLSSKDTPESTVEVELIVREPEDESNLDSLVSAEMLIVRLRTETDMEQRLYDSILALKNS